MHVLDAGQVSIMSAPPGHAHHHSNHGETSFWGKSEPKVPGNGDYQKCHKAFGAVASHLQKRSANDAKVLCHGDLGPAAVDAANQCRKHVMQHHDADLKRYLARVLGSKDCTAMNFEANELKTAKGQSNDQSGSGNRLTRSDRASRNLTGGSDKKEVPGEFLFVGLAARRMRINNFI